MIIYIIVNSWNVNSFTNSSSLKIWCFPKLKYLGNFWNFQNYKFFEFLKLQISNIFQISNFWDFPNWTFFEFSKSTIFKSFQIGFFFNVPNCSFLEFSKLKFFRISQIWIFRIVEIGKLRNFEIFFQFGKSNFGSKNWQFQNCSSIRYSAFVQI